MRKTIFNLIPFVAMLAIAAPAAQAQQMPGAEDMNKRFEQMDRRMEDAQKSDGTARRQHMHEHMQMMHDQMLAMHGMMGDGMMGRGGPRMGMGRGGRMGNGPHGSDARLGPGGGPRMQQLQNRVDMMQRMMEQMQKQHELMLKDRSGNKN